MTISIQSATNGTLGFDCDTVLTSNTAQAFITAGFKFAIRYLSLASLPQLGDLNATEVYIILQSGLALMAVQHVAYAGWLPSVGLGHQNGSNAASCAFASGLPAGITIWLDLEGVNSSARAADVIAYCNAWCAAVSTSGYMPGLYVGANSILTGDQLYWDLTVTEYWQSGSTVPAVTTRGYCMVQTINNSLQIDGVAYDKDVIQTDALGGTPIWAINV